MKEKKTKSESAFDKEEKNILNNSLKDVPKIEIKPPKEKTLEESFEEFEKESTSFAPPVTNKIEDGEGVISLPSTEQSGLFKLKMFMGFCSFVLVGFNTFALNALFKKDITSEQLELKERERDGIMIYFNTPEVLTFLSKIPTAVWGLIHIEWMMIQKYKHAVKIKELESKTKK